MDNIEITVFDEINDYKEKIYFFNFRQWIFAIIIVCLVVPTYIFLKDKIGEETTSYIVIAIAGILGFIGFVKIHELPAEKILPYWKRHYFLFAKPIHYISDNEYNNSHQRKGKNKKKAKAKKENKKLSKKELKAKKKQEKLAKKTNKKVSKKNKKNKKNQKDNKDKKNKQEKINNKKLGTVNENKNSESKLVEKLSKLTKEEQEVLLKLIER